MSFEQFEPQQIGTALFVIIFAFKSVQQVVYKCVILVLARSSDEQSVMPF